MSTATPEIFLSYSRDEQATARLFAEGFEAAGFSVWWDVTLKSGEDYDRVTEQALRGAKAVVVLWSAESVESRWVRTEATIALQGKTLVPVMITACQRPIMFELTQTADLSHWNGDAHDSVWLTFLHDVQQFVQRGVAARVSESPTLTPASPTLPPLPRRPLPATAKRYSPLQFWLRALPLAVVVAALVGLAAWQFKPEAPRPVTRFVHDLPEGRSLILTLPGVLAIAPDGRRLVYNSSDGLVVRDLDALEERVIPGTTARFVMMAFSPDGESLAFLRSAGGVELVRMALTGGVEVVLASGLGTVNSLSWQTDGTLLFSSPSAGIYRVSANGGEPELIVAIEPHQNAATPQLLPGGEWVLFTLSSTGPRPDLVAQSLVTGERKLLRVSANKGRYVPSGRLLYQEGSTLFAVAFDPATAALLGAAVPVVQGVRGGRMYDLLYALADDGTLIYIPGRAADAELTLALGDGQGNEQALAVPAGTYANPRASPDGRWIAYEAQYDDGSDIAVYEIGSAAVARRLTFGGDNTRPAWSADGTHVAYSSTRTDGPGLFWRLNDGTGVEERLTQAEAGATHTPDHFSPDGQTLAYTVEANGSSAIWQLGLVVRDAALLVEAPGLGASHAVFSPDGRWLAYQAYDTGDNEIYVQPFPSTGAKYQVPSRGDNHHPAWSPDGRQLYYIPGAGRLARVDVSTERGVGFGTPFSLTLEPLTGGPPNVARSYDLMPDGSILGTMPEGGEVDSDRIIVVQNWFEELNRLVPVE